MQPSEENDLNPSSPISRNIRKQELAPPSLEIETISPNLSAYQGPASPIHDSITSELQQPIMCRTSRSEHQFNRPQTPNQMIHSQSQTSFTEQYYNRAVSPSSLTGQFFTTSASNPQLCQYAQYSDLATPQYGMYPSQRFQPTTPIYSSQPWQQSLNICTPQKPSELFHSMPTPQDVRSFCIANSTEFPSTLPQRNLKRDQLSDQFPSAGTFPQNYKSSSKSQIPVSHKNVDFESPVAQSFEAPRMAQPEVKTQAKDIDEIPIRTKSPTNSNASNLSKSPPANTVSRPNSLKGSLRRRNKSASMAAKSSYEAYEERMLPALRQ